MRIVANNLSYTYNRGAKFAVTAINNVNLTIEKGEFFGIIGHTGSGKSTFIQHLNALILVQSGNLNVGEFDLTKQKKKDKAKFKDLRKQLGMVFQYPEYQLFADTVFDDVAFGLKNFYPELKGEEVAKKVRKALETVGLDYEFVCKKSPFDLSGGQKRRVALAGVIVTEPKILVLDEPVAGLDPQGKQELWKLLHKLNDEGTTIIVVSHDMNDVCENCTKLAVFSEGRVIASGKPSEIFCDEEFLKNSKLDYPLTVFLARELEKIGISIEEGCTINGFIKAVENYKNSR